MQDGQKPLFARQAIYDDSCNVLAYELLFRAQDMSESLVDNQCEASGDTATSCVITEFFANVNIEDISANKRIFINFTRNHLLNLVPTLLPKEKIVIEILEDMTIDGDLIAAVKHLHDLDYQIALDDFVYNDEIAQLIPYAKIIKFDVLDKSQQQIELELEKVKDFKGTLLAEKVEDHLQFETCKNLGFDFFQGYFLSRPALIKGKEISGNKVNTLKLLSALQNPDIEIIEVEQIIAHDPKLAYRVLLIANSAAISMGKKIKSLRDAILRLGLNNVRDWVCLLVLSKMDTNQGDLIETTIIRAKMSEAIGQRSNLADASTCYTLGMLSTLEAILQLPLAEALDKISLSDELNDALLQGTGALGDILENVIAYEQGNFCRLDFSKLSVDDYHSIYLSGLNYTQKILQALSS